MYNGWNLKLIFRGEIINVNDSEILYKRCMN